MFENAVCEAKPSARKEAGWSSACSLQQRVRFTDDRETLTMSENSDFTPYPSAHFDKAPL